MGILLVVDLSKGEIIESKMSYYILSRIQIIPTKKVYVRWFGIKQFTKWSDAQTIIRYGHELKRLGTR